MRTAWIVAALLSMASPSWAQTGAHASAQTLVQASRVEEADGTLTLVHEVEIAAPVASAWTAISTREGWTRWGVPVAWWDPQDPDVLETSYDPKAQPGAPQNIRQRFLVRVPNRLLAFQTIKAPAGFADAQHFAAMRTVFELTPMSAERTRVRLTGVGYPRNDAGRRLLSFFEQGNATTLQSLKTALETPAARPN